MKLTKQEWTRLEKLSEWYFTQERQREFDEFKRVIMEVMGNPGSPAQPPPLKKSSSYIGFIWSG